MKPIDVWAAPSDKPDLTSRHVILGPVTQRAGHQLGGTDWTHILNEPPYGCARRLTYVKRDEKRTDPSLDYQTNAQFRGKEMEAPIVKMYEFHTGFNVEPVYEFDLPETLPPWWRPHPDGKVTRNDGRGPGALEVKCPSIRGTWRSYRRDGLPGSWIMQLQGEMAALNVRWASAAILAWGGEYELWQTVDGDIPEFRRDDEMIGHMVELGEQFLAKMDRGNLPDKQDPTECKACATCPYLTACQGRELAGEIAGTAGAHDVLVIKEDAALESIIRQYDEFSAIKDEAEGEIDRLKLMADEALKARDAQAIRVAGRTMRRVQVKGRKGFDKKRLEVEKPGVFKEYLTLGKPTSHVRIFAERT